MFRKILTLIKNNRDYFSAIFTGYGYFGVQVLVQILLVPLYLSALGKHGLGVLMILMAAVGISFQGIGWAYGVVLRLMGAAAASDDRIAFSNGYAAAKWIYVLYALIVLVILGSLFVLFGSSWKDTEDGIAMTEVWRAAPLAAIHFLLLIEFAVDQNALNAIKRQAISNILLIISMVVFSALVIPWMMAGARISDVFICLIAGTLTARVIVWFYWRRNRPLVGWRMLDRNLFVVMRELMSAARSGHAAYGLIFMGLQADVLIFGMLGGPAAAAEFVLVWKVAEVLVLLLWRLSESLLPELIHADAKNDRDRLVRIYRRGIVLLRLVCLALGCLYAIVGQFLVNLWLGSAAAPQSALAFALAGGAIFWLGSARLPALFAYALGGVDGLAKVAGVELFMKLALIWLLYDKMGFLAPLVAINAVHFCGLAYAYARLSKHTVFGR